MMVVNRMNDERKEMELLRQEVRFLQFQLKKCEELVESAFKIFEGVGEE